MVLVEEEDDSEPPTIEIMSTAYVHHDDGTHSARSQILTTLSNSQHDHDDTRGFEHFEENVWEENGEMVGEYSRTQQAEEVPMKKKRKAVSDNALVHETRIYKLRSEGSASGGLGGRSRAIPLGIPPAGRQG